MPVQNPFPVSGRVTLATKGYGSPAVAQAGCRIWIQDLTESTVRISYHGTAAKENIYITQTNSDGYYILDIADLTVAYAQSDRVRVYCEWDGGITWQDFILHIADGAKTLNFTLHKHSGLIDGCKKGVTAADFKHGLQHLGTGLKPGLKGMGRNEDWL